MKPPKQKRKRIKRHVPKIAQMVDMTKISNAQQKRCEQGLHSYSQFESLKRAEIKDGDEIRVAYVKIKEHRCKYCANELKQTKNQ